MEFDPDLLASIASGGLGHWVSLEDGSQKYTKDDDCLACLKDLLGFFRFDDPEQRPAFFAISKYNIVKSDLVPLIVTYPEDYEIIYNALKVCTYLTMPTNQTARALMTQQTLLMQQVCEAFLEENAIAVVVTLLAEPLSRHPRMTDKDTALVELVVTFLRNLLACTSARPEASFGEKETGKRIHFTLVKKFLNEDVMELLHIMAQRARERPFKSQSPVLLEIFLNVFSFTPPEDLVTIPKPKQVHLKSVLTNEDMEQRMRDKRRAYQAAPKLPTSGPGRTVTRYGPARQQFAGAVFMRRHKDHSGGVLVRHAPNQKELPAMPQAPNKKKAKAQAKDRSSHHDSLSSHKEIDGFLVKEMQTSPREIEMRNNLRDLLNRFLNEAYTPLVGQVFKDARPGLDISRLEEDDFERFVRFVAYCTKYVRLRVEKKFKGELLKKQRESGVPTVDDESLEEDAASSEKESGISPFASISATMGWDAFHMVQVLFLMSVDREIQRSKDKEKPYRPHILLYSLGPLLREMLMTMDLARIAGNPADRQAADRLQRKLLHNDDKTGMLHVLSQLIRDYKYHLHPRFHAVHLAEILHVVLATLDRLSQAGSFQVSKKSKKHKKRKKKKDSSNANHSQEGTGDEDKQHDNSIAAPEMQPSSDHQNDELNATVGQNEAQKSHNEQTGAIEHQNEELQAKKNDDQEEDEEEEIEEEEEQYSVREEAFDAPKRLRIACGHPQMVEFYVWLLQGYQTNTELTNLAIISFLERLSAPLPKGLGLHCMLWQLSVIRTFHSIMSNAQTQRDPRYKGIMKLCVSTVRSLLERLNPDLTMFEEQIKLAEKKHDECKSELKLIQLIENEEEREKKNEEVSRKLQEAEAEIDEANLEIKMKKECASLAFVEILFWKNATIAESMASEYHWKRHLEVISDIGGNPQLGFASYKAPKAPGSFTEEQTQMLIDAFENYNGTKNLLSKLEFEFGGAFKKVHISKKLRELGLEKGKLTSRQENMLRILSERHAHVNQKVRFETITDELGGGFSVRQIKRNMRRLNLLVDDKKKKNADDNDLSVDGSSSSDDENDAAQQEESDVLDPEKAFDNMMAELSPPNSPLLADEGDTRTVADHTRVVSNSEELRPVAGDSPAPMDADIHMYTTSGKKRSLELGGPGDKNDDDDEAAAELQAAESRKRALELLRSKHLKAVNNSDQAPSKYISAIEEPERDAGKDHIREGGENVEANNSPVKTFGRRLLKKASNTNPPSDAGLDILAGLEDF